MSELFMPPLSVEICSKREVSKLFPFAEKPFQKGLGILDSKQKVKEVVSCVKFWKLCQGYAFPLDKNATFYNVTDNIKLFNSYFRQRQ